MITLKQPGWILHYQIIHYHKSRSYMGLPRADLITSTKQNITKPYVWFISFISITEYASKTWLYPILTQTYIFLLIMTWLICVCVIKMAQWRHNERDGVSNRRILDRLLKRLLRLRAKLRFTGLCEGNSPVTSGFPSQRASNAENVSIWWCHHVIWYHSKWLAS